MNGLNLDTPSLFAGGRLCLDFINTSCRRREDKIEFIGDDEALRRWLRLAEFVTGHPLSIDEAEEDPAFLSHAHALRAALHNLVHSAMEKQPPTQEALEIVNAALRAAPTYAQIEYTSQGYQKSVLPPPAVRPLAAIAADAIDLLCHSDLSLLRQCECPTCVRVFYDTTKNHKRRWCVEKCGSAPKAAAYYRRKVAKAAQSQPYNAGEATQKAPSTPSSASGTPTP